MERSGSPGKRFGGSVVFKIYGDFLWINLSYFHQTGDILSTIFNLFNITMTMIMYINIFYLASLFFYH